MPIKVGINGYGRIGRNILRALYEAKRTAQIQIVAVNDLGDAQTNAHLTRYDTVHGRFPGEVQVDGNAMVVNGDRIRVLAERDPSKLPWGELGAEFILECTGLFSSRAKASAHLKGGAKKVVISAPGGEDVDATIVYGVNDALLKSSYTVISNASCTTNCLAPVAKVLHDNIGIVAGLMTTIHSYTNDQVLTDVYHSDLRRARSATSCSISAATVFAASCSVFMSCRARRKSRGMTLTNCDNARSQSSSKVRARSLPVNSRCRSTRMRRRSASKASRAIASARLARSACPPSRSSTTWAGQDAS